MEGMVRGRKSEGIHDPLQARALYLAGEAQCAIVSIDICAIDRTDALRIKQDIEAETGTPAGNIVLAASHTHSGPATLGIFNPKEPEYVRELSRGIVESVRAAIEVSRPALCASASGCENTISHYRRFLADTGETLMLWERNPSLGGMSGLGEPDPEVGVLKIVDAGDPRRLICVLFNHAGHPNVMSGENYLISADYPGIVQRHVEGELSCVALFTNGAQGSVDIDNWKYRDWSGMETLGRRLARVVIETAAGIACSNSAVHCLTDSYALRARAITESELQWADRVLTSSGGRLNSMADGVGDDYKALLYRTIHDSGIREIVIDQTCIIIGGCALLSFPGEMFTEIGIDLKKISPHPRVWVIGLANGYAGYIPTAEAIARGGYEVETRRADETAAQVILDRSRSLLDEACRVL